MPRLSSRARVCLALALLTLAGCGKPATYGGTWEGPESKDFHVARVVISSNEFPCPGSLELQAGGQVFKLDVTWEKKGDGLAAKDSAGELATAKLTGDKLSGT